MSKFAEKVHPHLKLADEAVEFAKGLGVEPDAERVVALCAMDVQLRCARAICAALELIWWELPGPEV